jgi:hypothetical protein
MDQPLEAYSNSVVLMALESLRNSRSGREDKSQPGRGGKRLQKNIWVGKFLKFPAQIVRDDWVARGNAGHLMWRFSFSRLCRVSISEWLLERLSVVSHYDWSAVEKPKRFSRDSRYASSLTSFKPRRRLIFSAFPINAVLLNLSSLFFLCCELLCPFCSRFTCFLLLSLILLKRKMPRGGEDSDGLGDAHPATWESKLTRADERRVRRECFIPPFVSLRFDEKKVGAIVRSDRHEVCVYEAMFRAGLRLPFLPMVRELLNYLDLAPHQLRAKCVEVSLRLHGAVAIRFG